MEALSYNEVPERDDPSEISGAHLDFDDVPESLQGTESSRSISEPGAAALAFEDCACILALPKPSSSFSE